MKRSMTSFDIHFIVKELQVLIGARIQNVYSLGRIWVLKTRGGQDKKSHNLLIEPGVRIHLTEYKRQFPERPENKTLILRQKIKGMKISEINQRGTDRLVILKLAAVENSSQLICELFGKGNIILLDDTPRVVFASWYKKMRDRDLLPGKKFEFPPLRGHSLMDSSVDARRELFIQMVEDNQKKKLIVAFSHFFGVSGEVLEEILYLAGIPKSEICSNLSDNWISSFEKGFSLLLERTISLKPCIVKDDNGIMVNVLPFPFDTKLGTLEFSDNLSISLDAYFSPSEIESHGKEDIKSTRLIQFERTLQDQEDHIVRLREKAEKEKNKGDLIYKYYNELDELFSTILGARRKGVPWKEISDKLDKGKSQGLKLLRLYQEIQPDNKTIVVLLDEESLSLDFTQGLREIANSFYKASKKSEGKIEPAFEAIKKTKEKIAKAQMQTAEIEARSKLLLKARKRKWFEKFIWTHTLNDFLVVAGRDIKSNEVLVRRYMQSNDIFLHADVHGAPYVLLRGSLPDDAPKDEDINIAARVAASFSSAWKAMLGVCDVYSVSPDQVSFSAPSGEFIPKGGVMIRGKKNYIRNVELKFCLGVVIEEEYAQVIGGVYEVISKKTPLGVYLKPGSLKKGEIAKKIKSALIKRASDPTSAEKIRHVDLNDFVSFIPGPSQIQGFFSDSKV